MVCVWLAHGLYIGACGWAVAPVFCRLSGAGLIACAELLALHLLLPIWDGARDVVPVTVQAMWFAVMAPFAFNQ